MADVTVNKSTPSAATCSFVLDAYETERDQLHALAWALVNELEPKDPKNPEDSDRLTAWRLAEVMYDMLSEARLTTFAREMLLGEVPTKAPSV